MTIGASKSTMADKELNHKITRNRVDVDEGFVTGRTKRRDFAAGVHVQNRSGGAAGRAREDAGVGLKVEKASERSGLRGLWNGVVERDLL